ncbi:MAG: hypothetical protein AB8C95_04200 [Phycisphaeraceae bacterium]
MRLAAIFLLFIAMLTFSIGVENFNNYQATGDDAEAQAQGFGYAVGTFALPAIALGCAWFCWRKSSRPQITPDETDQLDE